MKEAFNSGKMLVNIPSEMAIQTVHVDGELFYFNELLQQKLSHHFIPEWFFHIKDKDQVPCVDTLCKADLFALGHEVEYSEV